MQKALITGITGQDGSYLAEFLLSKGYRVYGTYLKGETLPFIFRLPKMRKVVLYEGSLADRDFVCFIVRKSKPDEVYNLGAQSNVSKSFEIPEYTGNVTGLGVVRLLEAIRHYASDAKLYQASSCEMFGKACPPQSENTQFDPLNPYACAKVYAYHSVCNYRSIYNLFACNGILFHHESPRRGSSFVTRKITQSIANILAGKQQKLILGNLDVKRDWGFAPEYVHGMWKILQQDKADNFVLGTGNSYSLREFVELAFRYVGIELCWNGDGVNEKAIAVNTVCSWPRNILPGNVLIEVSKEFFRPSDGLHMVADITKASQEFGWRPMVMLQDLIAIMLDFDLALVNLDSVGLGFDICKSKLFNYITHESSEFTKKSEVFYVHKLL